MSSFTSFIQSLPSLHLRKDIWTHFPVCLVKMPYSDGRDRYAIQWHQKNMTEWSQGIPQYPMITQCRLMHALKKSVKWDVEPPKTSTDLCVIAMRYEDALVPLKEEVVQPAVLDVETPPVIQHIEELRDLFPVCWKAQQSVVHLEFHNTLVRSMAKARGVSEMEIRLRTLRLLPKALGDRWEMRENKSKGTHAICTLVPRGL